MDEDFVIFTENIASDLTSADISKRLKKKNVEVIASLKNLSEQINTSFSIIIESIVELEQKTLIHTGMTFFF